MFTRARANAVGIFKKKLLVYGVENNFYVPNYQLAILYNTAHIHTRVVLVHVRII